MSENLFEDWKDIERVLYHHNLLYVPEIICSILINCHHNNLLASHIEINKMQKLIAKKYYIPMFRYNIKVYKKHGDVYLCLKAVCHKLYSNFKSHHLIFTHYSKNLSIDYFTSLPISTNWKDNNYDPILIIVYCFIKIVYYTSMII